MAATSHQLKLLRDQGWLGSVTSLLAVATCYGTLALALLGMVYSWRIHPNRHRL